MFPNGKITIDPARINGQAQIPDEQRRLRRRRHTIATRVLQLSAQIADIRRAVVSW